MANAIEDGIEKVCRSPTCENVKLVIGSIAVFLLIVVLLIGVGSGYSVLKLPPPANFVLLFFALVLLAYVEALHYACVAIEKWDMEKYTDKYPRAVQVHSYVNTPEKVQKFLVGRQFFVIFIVFLIAEITTFPEFPKNFAGMPELFVIIIIRIGLPGVALTLNVGQLISQIYVEEFTLQFLNLFGCVFVTLLSLFAEWIGICNFSWFLFGATSRLFYKKERRIQKGLDKDASNKSTDNMVEPVSPHTANRGPDFDTGLGPKELNWFDYLKYIWSTIVTLGSIVIVLYGISIQAYVLPIPPAGAYVLGLALLTMLYYLEGLMIAIVGVQYWDGETFKDVYPRAYKIHQLMSRPENVKRFIIGRQFFVVLTNFLLAQIFVFANWPSEGYNPVLFFIVIKSGLVGVFIILAFAQLLPELLGAQYPLRFMNMYGSYTMVYISLFFDTLGVGHAAWSIYYVTRRCLCGKEMHGDHVLESTKPTIIRVTSAEVIAKQNKHRRGDSSAV